MAIPLGVESLTMTPVPQMRYYYIVYWLTISYVQQQLGQVL